jgi:hypothetical protein
MQLSLLYVRVGAEHGPASCVFLAWRRDGQALLVEMRLAKAAATAAADRLYCIQKLGIMVGLFPGPRRMPPTRQRHLTKTGSLVQGRPKFLSWDHDCFLEGPWGLGVGGSHPACSHGLGWSTNQADMRIELDFPLSLVPGYSAIGGPQRVDRPRLSSRFDLSRHRNMGICSTPSIQFGARAVSIDSRTHKRLDMLIT